MPMGQPMPEGQPAPEESQGGGAGGAAKLLADAHSSMMKLMELMSGKMPEEEQMAAGVVQGLQGLAEALGQAQGSKPQGPAGPATTSPEAGAAAVQPA